MSILRWRDNFLENYTAIAPLALAVERTLECRLLSERELVRPVLDLGCGDGVFARMLCAEPMDTGMDPNPDELERARRQASYNELVCCWGNAIPKPDHSYETVLSNSVLEHIQDLAPVLSEVFRILKPGGAFYFTVPCDNFEIHTVVNRVLVALGMHTLSVRYRQFFNRMWKHYHAYPAGQWRAIAEQAGFDVIEVFRYDAPHVALLNDALVPVALPSILLKKLVGRWVLSPGLRRIMLKAILPQLEMRIGKSVQHPEGCLVFVKAVKKAVL